MVSSSKQNSPSWDTEHWSQFLWAFNSLLWVIRPFFVPSAGWAAAFLASTPGIRTGKLGHLACHNKILHNNLEAMAPNLTAMASNLTAMASNITAMASNLTAMASDLIAMASNLTAMASDLIAMASNLEAMASNLI